MSVNDLIEKWGGQADDFGVCSANLQELAHTAWHPVSKPPTDADGDEHGRVLFKPRRGIPIQIEKVAIVSHASESLQLEKEGRIPKQMGLPRNGQWARISDVVLFPILEERD